MKNTKVDFGPRCTRCNKKIPTAQQGTLRFERTGVCAHCARELNPLFFQVKGYSGAFVIMLPAGQSSAAVTKEEIRGVERIALIGSCHAA